MEKRRRRLSGCGLCLCLAVFQGAGMAQTIPSAPTNLVATAPWYNQIILGWSDVSTNEDGFKIERSTDGSVFSQITQVLPNTVAYRDTLTWPGTTYTYRVRAYNKGGNSGYSPVATIASPTPCETTVIAWGEDTFGSTATPTGLTGVVAADDGALDGLILKSDGTVIGWGENDYGEATPPAGLTGVVAVAAGDYHSLALKGDGTVVGWGYNYSGEASPPAGLTNAVAIDAGGAHSLALKADGTVVGWGYNAYGQASPPPGLTGVVAIGAGYEHSLALKSDGTVVGWGHNQYGQASTPPGLSNIVAIAVGDYHNLALQSDGSIVGWGYSYAGETNTPAGLTGVVAIGAGDYFSMALKSDGTVVGWGYPRATVPPAGLTGILSIGVGFGDCVAVTCAPYAPSGLMATTISSNEIDLVWTNNASTQTGFAIERALDNGSGSPGTWAQVTTVGANVTNYDDTGVMPSTIYWYRVRAYDAEGYSPYCNQASAATPPLAAPSGLVLHILSASQISLTWTDDSTAEDGFSIERARQRRGSWNVGPGRYGDGEHHELHRHGIDGGHEILVPLEGVQRRRLFRLQQSGKRNDATWCPVESRGRTGGDQPDQPILDGQLQHRGRVQGLSGAFVQWTVPCDRHLDVERDDLRRHGGGLQHDLLLHGACLQRGTIQFGEFEPRRCGHLGRGQRRGRNPRLLDDAVFQTPNRTDQRQHARHRRPRWRRIHAPAGVPCRCRPDQSIRRLPDPVGCAEWEQQPRCQLDDGHRQDQRPAGG